MCKKPLFLSLFLGKRGQIGKKSKKNCCGHQLRTMTYFSKYHTFDPLLYLGCQMLRTLFFLLFLGKTGQITRYLGKKTYGHQLGPMTHFLTTPKFDLLLYIGEKCLQTHLPKLPVRTLINDPPKKLIQTSTTTHGPFFDEPQI